MFAYCRCCHFSRIPSIDACFDRFCLSKQEGFLLSKLLRKQFLFVIDTAIYARCRANSCDNYMYRLCRFVGERTV